MYLFFLITATNISGDYDALSVTWTFQSGYGDGDMLCEPLMVNSDNLVESNEDLRANLALETPGSSIHLGNNVSFITIIDSNGNACWQ